MLADDGTVKLIDFDAAKEYKANATEDTTTLGTKAYAAPEQFGYTKTDVRTDIYCIGATMYHMLADKPYINGSEIPGGKIGRIIQKCLQVDPKKRYPSAAELKKDLFKLQKRAGKKIIVGALAILAASLIVFIALYISGNPVVHHLESPAMAFCENLVEDTSSVQTTEPVPTTEPAPTAEPIPTTDPAPTTEPMPTAEPVPTTEPDPIAEYIPEPDFTPPQIIPTPPPDPTPSPTPPPTPEPSSAYSGPVYITEELLFDINGIRLTVTGLNFNHWGDVELNVHIENNSDNAMTVTTRYESVNGFMFPSALLLETVTPGNRTNARVRFSQDNLERVGVETIGVIELAFVVFCQEDWSNRFVTEIFHFETSAPGQFEQPLPEVQHMAFESGGVYIEYMGDGERFSGVEFLFLVRNSTDYAVSVRTNNEAVNGLMVSGLLVGEVLPGKSAVLSLIFHEWNLEENGIENIEIVEFNFIVYRSDDVWDSRVTSEKISIIMPPA